MVLALLLGAFLAADAPADPLDVRPEPYRQAVMAGAVGAISGRAVAEARRPDGAEEPITPSSLTLLPRSELLLGRLAEIRRGARRDPNLYRASAKAVVTARRWLERALAESGSGDLVRYVEVAPDGTFELDSLPAGDWILLAQHAVFVRKDSPVAKKREREIFQRQPRMSGYYAVTIWLRELKVSAGRVERVLLTDRDPWMTAIEEERILDAGH
jgi:hypothetical protein